MKTKIEKEAIEGTYFIFKQGEWKPISSIRELKIGDIFRIIKPDGQSYVDDQECSIFVADSDPVITETKIVIGKRPFVNPIVRIGLDGTLIQFIRDNFDIKDKEISIKEARAVIKNAFESDSKPGGLKYVYIDNISVMLQDKHKICRDEADQTAKQIVRLIFY